MSRPRFPSGGGGEPLDDPLAEALRLIGLADGAGLQLRLMGGLAFHAAVPTWRAAANRERRDIDLATRGRDRSAVAELLSSSGYQADRRYNALYGQKQLYFVDVRHERPVDVLIDRLEMCHAFSFVDRLLLERLTLPLADLLLSKLQVVKINRKDLVDALILLQTYPLGDTDTGVISLPRITRFTSSDWGWWRTLTGNLKRLQAFVEQDLAPDELSTDRQAEYDLSEQIVVLHSAIDAAPKSAAWKLRARIGERIRWYEEPEEVAHAD